MSTWAGWDGIVTGLRGAVVAGELSQFDPEVGLSNHCGAPPALREATSFDSTFTASALVAWLVRHHTGGHSMSSAAPYTGTSAAPPHKPRRFRAKSSRVVPTTEAGAAAAVVPAEVAAAQRLALRLELTGCIVPVARPRRWGRRSLHGHHETVVFVPSETLIYKLAAENRLPRWPKDRGKGDEVESPTRYEDPAVVVALRRQQQEKLKLARSARSRHRRSHTEHRRVAPTPLQI